MHLMLSYEDGKIVEAVVLSANGDRMRISIPNYEDTVELRSEQDGWMLESGERVEIECIVVANESSAVFPEARPLTFRAAAQAIS